MRRRGQDVTDTPTGNGTPPEERNTRMSRRTQLVLLSVILLIIAAVVVVVVLLLTSGNEAGDGGTTGTLAGDTDITSPYDLHELSADTGPGDVQKASLVSISLPAADGASDYYGLSSDTEPAKALMKAVADADEVEASEESTSSESTTTDQVPLSTLTFLFPDRSTLTFELDVDAGTVARGGRVWLVDGDLAALVDAAISLQEGQ